MKTRYYRVTNTATGVSVLVNAVSQAQAIGHVARSELTCKVASTTDAVEAMRAGAQIMDATTEPAAPTLE